MINLWKTRPSRRLPAPTVHAAHSARAASPAAHPVLQAQPATDLFSLTDLTQRYGDRTVLAIDRLTVRAGEILAVVGPSGAGKSTLLRLLNFLEPPTAGTIDFLGRRFSSQETPPLDMRRKVTTVFQRPVLLRRSVYANVAYGLQLRGTRHFDDQIRAVIDQVGLTNLADAPARTLSGGEAQRVALARAMILRPTALLMDEPTANLDPYNVGLIESITRQINAEQGAAVVLVTHNIFQARRLAHRVALLLDGCIVELAETEAFFDRPQDRRTGAFVRGEMIY